MKVYIGKYKKWIGPYQIAEKLLFWKNHRDDVVFNFGEKLSKIKWLVKFCNYVDSKRNRNVNVRIDYYDTWSMDHTLAYIVVPMLKQLKQTKHGAPFVDDADVPEHLRKSVAPSTENDWDTDENYFKRWDWVLDEMIFAFESKLVDWEEQFWIRQPTLDLANHSGDDEFTRVVMIDKIDKGECDWNALKVYQERITNGFRLFGKYYEGLWD